MNKSPSIEMLRSMLVNAECRACDNDFIVRMSGREEVRKLKARLARKERDSAMRDLGMKKVRGALGGTYWE